MLIIDKIKNIFKSKCCDCKHHNGGTICKKLGGFVKANCPICGYFKERPKQKKKEKKQ